MGLSWANARAVCPFDLISATHLIAVECGRRPQGGNNTITIAYSKLVIGPLSKRVLALFLHLLVKRCIVLAHCDDSVK